MADTNKELLEQLKIANEREQRKADEANAIQAKRDAARQKALEEKSA